jgi:hypothetical protein
MLPVEKEYAECVYWMYTVLLPKCSAEARNVVGRFCRAAA